MRIAGQRYIKNGVMSANITGDIVSTGSMRDVTFQLDWGATGSPAGVFTWYGSDDPLALEDKQNGTTRARWQAMTIPTPSAPAVHATVSGTGATIDGTANAGGISVTFSNPPTYMQLRYAFSGGTANTSLQGFVSGTP